MIATFPLVAIASISTATGVSCSGRSFLFPWWQEFPMWWQEFPLFCKDKYICKLLAYCLMPNHIHLVLWPDQSAAISDFMRDFKKFTSVQIRRALEQEGEVELLNILKANAKGAKGQVFKLWKDRFDDLVLNQRETMITKINYIHANSVRKGLVSMPEDWFYSSARNYLSIGTSAIPVDMEW